MRLIDEDVLLQAMDKRYSAKKDIVPNNLAEGFMQMEKLIKEQPTAYDVEKVVEQLKEWSFEAEIVIPQSDGYDDTTTKEIISTPIATEIVKEGGAE